MNMSVWRCILLIFARLGIEHVLSTKPSPSYKKPCVEWSPCVHASSWWT